MWTPTTRRQHSRAGLRYAMTQLPHIAGPDMREQFGLCFRRKGQAAAPGRRRGLLQAGGGEGRQILQVPASPSGNARSALAETSGASSIGMRPILGRITVRTLGNARSWSAAREAGAASSRWPHSSSTDARIVNRIGSGGTRRVCTTRSGTPHAGGKQHGSVAVHHRICQHAGHRVGIAHRSAYMWLGAV